MCLSEAVFEQAVALAADSVSHAAVAGTNVLAVVDIFAVVDRVVPAVAGAADIYVLAVDYTAVYAAHTAVPVALADTIVLDAVVVDIVVAVAV